MVSQKQSVQKRRGVWLSFYFNLEEIVSTAPSITGFEGSLCDASYGDSDVRNREFLFFNR